MRRVPDFYDRFRCLAGQCPHTCCEKWMVVLDEETVALYQGVVGELGWKLRREMAEVEGEICFPLRGGRCPFLDGENLCEIHRALGEEATSLTCRSHPRFMEAYEGLTEVTLAASCPAANALLFGSEEPLTFVELDDGETPLPDPLFALRGEMFAVLYDRERPLGERLQNILALGLAAQSLVDEGEDDALYDLRSEDAAVGEVEGEPLFPAAFDFLRELEVLEEDWTELLSAAEGAQSLDMEANAPALERLCAYFLFRYLCKAMGDGDVLGKVELAVFAVVLTARLGAAAGVAEAARMLSREMEHSGENMEALWQGFCFDERLGVERILAALQ
ncbi:MAG: flagellin lysine-N-methylase [Oscillibacter sp.]|nr:flagellin lysine-N-methylase [Oscillibacter sp.]